ncbi:MAG: hypothetical protein D6737_19495 [Chloroflexi bacterium]
MSQTVGRIFKIILFVFGCLFFVWSFSQSAYYMMFISVLMIITSIFAPSKSPLFSKLDDIHDAVESQSASELEATLKTYRQMYRDGEITEAQYNRLVMKALDES